MKESIISLNRSPQLSDWFDSQLDYLIEKNIYADNVNKVRDGLVKKLEKYRKDHRVENVVLGMSGGIDSALTANLFRLAGWKVTPVIMPIYQDPEETGRGIEAAAAMGADYIVRDLSTMYDKVIAGMDGDHLGIADDNLSALKRRGNVRARLRMITLYDLASQKSGLVASTDNFSELAAGFWTLHGDVGDVAPIQSLTKSWEVPAIAQSIPVPLSIIQATPTDGLGIANGDEDQFGYSYLEFDIVLLSLLNNVWCDAPQSARDTEIIYSVKNRISGTAFKRDNPHNMDHPVDKKRFSGLAKLDKSLIK